jgi:hypothetical protein
VRRQKILKNKVQNLTNIFLLCFLPNIFLLAKFCFLKKKLSIK